MSLTQSPKVVTNGLAFYIDVPNTQKSWKGLPTTNHFYYRNPRIDESYTTYVRTTEGTWEDKHPNAIRVYNESNTDISNLTNSGVTDYTNKYHAVWEYDEVLKRPVVVMNDVDASWKAFSWYHSETFVDMGLDYGDQYVISWLQWTDDITKSTNAGLYNKNLSGTNGFWDGQSNNRGPTAYNTKPHTWERVYAVFTVSTSRDLSSAPSVYMYGQYGPRAMLKITDVQMEVTSTPSSFTKSNTRSNTESMVDLIGGGVVTVNSLTREDNNNFSFEGSTNSNITFPTPYDNTVSALTWEVAMTGVKTTPGDYGYILHNGPTISTGDSHLTIGVNVSGFIIGSFDGKYATMDSDVSESGTQVKYMSLTWDGFTQKLYINGVLKKSTSLTSLTKTINSTTCVFNSLGGYRPMSGTIEFVRCYVNRALSDDEVMRNFTSFRSRYGI